MTTRRFTRLQAMAWLLPGLVMSGILAPRAPDPVGYAALATALLALTFIAMKTYTKELAHLAHHGPTHSGVEGRDR